MNIVVKSEDGKLYFNPAAIEYAGNRTTCAGVDVSPVIVVTATGGREAASRHYPLALIKEAINRIYMKFSDGPACYTRLDDQDIKEYYNMSYMIDISEALKVAELYLKDEAGD